MPISFHLGPYYCAGALYIPFSQVAAELGRAIVAGGADPGKSSALANAIAEIGTPPPGAEKDAKAKGRRVVCGRQGRQRWQRRTPQVQERREARGGEGRQGKGQVGEGRRGEEGRTAMLTPARSDAAVFPSRPSYANGCCLCLGGPHSNTASVQLPDIFPCRWMQVGRLCF